MARSSDSSKAPAWRPVRRFGRSGLQASVVLAKFQQLYDVEDRAKATSPDERLAFRQTEAAPIWTSLGESLDGDVAAGVLPTEPCIANERRASTGSPGPKRPAHVG